MGKSATELRRLVGRHALALAAFAVAGWMLGHIFAVLFVGTLACLIWHLAHLNQLHRWLQGNISHTPMPADAVWSGLYDRIQTLDRLNRKRKRKLNRMLKRFREGVTALPDAAVVLNGENQVEWSNRAAQRLLGLRGSDDIGLPLTTIVRNPSFVRYLNAWNQEQSVTIPSPVDASVHLRVRAVPLAKRQCLLLASDVSEVQRLERMRRDFVANASHELRTPLTVINGYLEALLDSEGAPGNPWRAPLGNMHEQGERMLRIIEDLLLLSRLETDSAPATAPVAVPSMLEAIAEDARALSGDLQHALSLEVDASLWLKGSESELRSAFTNLVINAVRHTPARTAIAVRWYGDASAIHFEVHDQGPGIAPQHINRLSERFYRIDPSRQRDEDGKIGGTGLGLAIAKHVAQRHRGELRIASALGNGSVFSFEFPLSERSPALVSDQQVVGAG